MLKDNGGKTVDFVDFHRFLSLFILNGGPILGTQNISAPSKAEKSSSKKDDGFILNTYETIFILKPSLSEEETLVIIEKIKGIIEQQGGEIAAVENWGKRKLAYEVQNERKGVYIVIHFKGPGTALREIERNYRISESIIKYMTIKIGIEKLGQALPIKEERVFSPRARMGRSWR